MALHSFPDSRSMELRTSKSVRDSSFLFRFPRSKNRDTGWGGERDFLYGYAFCRQRRDQRLARGGEQSSVVVLSTRPFHAVLRKTMMFVGPQYFNEGEKALAQALQDISQWPEPVPGKTLQLQLLEKTFSARMPDTVLLPGKLQLSGIDGTHVKQDNATFHASGAVSGINWHGSLFPELDIYLAFQGVVLHLWTLWEIMLLNEPIMVMGPSPGSCSSAVAGLLSLISPLVYSSDFRPYFTVQDPEFIEYSQGGGKDRTKLPVCIGATNLHFLRALEGFPNIVSVGARSNAFEPAGMIQMFQSYTKQSSLLGSLTNRFKGTAALIAQEEEGLWAKHRPVITPDHQLVASMASIPEGCNTSRANQIASANSAAIRRHFAELTASFLEPFMKYFKPAEVLWSARRGSLSAAFAGPSSLPKFLPADFLADLQKAGPPPLVRRRLGAKWLSLYVEFITTSNFSAWYEQQYSSATARVRRNWLRERMVLNIEDVLPQMDEVLLVDAFATVEKQLNAELESHSDDDISAERFHEIILKLKDDMTMIYKALPTDLQSSLMVSKRRSSIINFGKIVRVDGAVDGVDDGLESVAAVLLERQNSQELELTQLRAAMEAVEREKQEAVAGGEGGEAEKEEVDANHSEGS